MPKVLINGRASLALLRTMPIRPMQPHQVQAQGGAAALLLRGAVLHEALSAGHAQLHEPVRKGDEGRPAGQAGEGGARPAN